MSAFSSSNRFKGNISSDVEALQVLHLQYPWIPNEEQIRPKKNVLMVKQEKLAIIHFQWRSVKDYIRWAVWELERHVDPCTSRYAVCDELIEPKVKFQANEFPYDLEPGSQHFVLWFCEKEQPISDCEITEMIEACVMEEFKAHPESFDFAWYPNPKMTVPEYFHVQIFLNLWTKSGPESVADPGPELDNENEEQQQEQEQNQGQVQVQEQG